MEDHRHEDYIPPPKPKLQAFSGAGHKLGRYEKKNQDLGLQQKFERFSPTITYVQAKTSDKRGLGRFGDILVPLSRETKLNMRFQE